MSLEQTEIQKGINAEQVLHQNQVLIVVIRAHMVRFLGSEKISKATDLS